jgi:hypothetical protein
MLEFLFEILGEFLLQAILEFFFELSVHAGWKPDRKPTNPWVAAIGYTVLGAVLGWLSLLVFPSYLVTSEPMRILNLILTPIAAGLLMAAMGAWRAQRGQPVLRIDKFAYGYLFAFALALVRFAAAE